MRNMIKNSGHTLGTLKYYFTTHRKRNPDHEYNMSSLKHIVSEMAGHCDPLSTMKWMNEWTN